MPPPANILAEILSGAPIPADKRQFFRDRLRDRLFEMITNELNAQELAGKTSIVDLAYRLGREPDQFDRLLATPDAWKLDDYVDMFLGLFGCELEVRPVPVADTVAIRLDR